MYPNAGDGVIERDPNQEKTFFEKRFHRLAESDNHSDCEFIVGPEKTVIKGHKVIFNAASEVFEAMFYGQLKEDKPVKVEDLSAEGFEGMKTFIYTGDISFTSAIHALLTYIAARKYLVPQLSNVCTKFIEEKLQPSEVLEFCDICRFNRITEFEELCLRIIQEKTDEVVDSEYFITAEPDTIELILKSPSLKLKSEIELFDHFERWALAEAEGMEISANEIPSRFNHLKKHIRFLTIKGDAFVSRFGESVLLTHEEKLAIAFNQIELQSKPVPDSISLINYSRKFNPSPSEYHQRFHTFTLQVGTYSVPREYRNIHIFSDYSSGVYWDFDEGFITCKFSLKYTTLIALIIIKSKLRVLALNDCDDLVFENEHKELVKSTSSKATDKEILLEAIPIIKLRNERFSRNVSSLVLSIQGTFKVQKINL